MFGRTNNITKTNNNIKSEQESLNSQQYLHDRSNIVYNLSLQCLWTDCNRQSHTVRPMNETVTTIGCSNPLDRRINDLALQNDTLIYEFTSQLRRFIVPYLTHTHTVSDKVGRNYFLYNIQIWSIYTYVIRVPSWLSIIIIIIIIIILLLLYNNDNKLEPSVAFSFSDCACMYVCMYVCIYVCKRVCVSKYTCVHLCIRDFDY